MIRLFKSTAAAIWSAALALVIVAGAITAAAHLAAPLLAGFRGDVEQWLESALRAPVRIEQLALRWRTQGPALVARNVAVLDVAGHAMVELGELTMTVALADLLREWRLRPSRVGISGVRLKVLRRADGSLGIEGVRPFEAGALTTPTQTPAATLIVLLPQRLHISDAQITVEDRMRGRPPLTFRNASLVVDNEGERHRISASLELPDGHRTPLTLAAELTASPDRLDDWQADLYLDTQGAELAPLLAQVLPPQYRLGGVEADLRLWSRWQRGDPLWIEGRAALRNAELGGVETGQGLRVDRVAGRFRWDQHPDGWQLRVTDFTLDRPDRPPTASEWGMAWRRAGADRPAGARLVAERLALEDLAAVLDIRPPGGEKVAALLAADPRGTVRGLDVSLLEQNAGDWQWSATGALAGGRIDAADGLPGIDNLGLRFSAGSGGGEIRLDTADARLALPGLYLEPVPVAELAGAIRWRRQTDGGWIVESPDLRLANADIRARSHFRLDLPAGGGAVLDLQANVDGLSADRALAYLPRPAMNDDLVRWLDASVQGGMISDVAVTLRGPLADFPFEERRTGEFLVRIGMQGGSLDFAPGWPGLREIDGEVRVEGYAVDVLVDRARLYDSRVGPAQARIDAPPGAPVEIKGTVRGPIADPLRLLLESPLSLDFGDIAEHLAGTGEVDLRLDFAVPIDDSAKERLKGELRFAGNELTVVDTPIRITGIDGRLGFDLDGLTAKGIKGRLLDVPATIDVKTDRSGATEVAATLRGVGPTALRALAGEAVAPARGTTDLKATLTVPPLRTGGRLLVRTESDLRGLAVALPAPLGKAAEAALPTTVEVAIPTTGPLDLRVRYGREVDVAALLDTATGRPTRGAVTLGGGRAEPPGTDRYALKGRLDELDVGAWLDWLASQQTAPTAPGRPPLDVDLATSRALLGTGSLAEVRLTARESPDAWQGEIRATELEGSFRYPLREDQGPATLTLARLALQSNPTEPAAAPAAAEESAQDPRALPGITLDVAQLQLNGQDFGRARAAAGRVEKGLQLRELSVDGPAGRLEGGGSWLMTEDGPRTALNFALDTPDFGRLITGLGFAETIDRGPARLNGELSWPGSPIDANRERVSGRVDLAMKEGRFLEVDPGIGRVIGLLNVTAIQRRLSLDFSDLFQKGLGFDSVTGHFELAAGVVQTDDLAIRGPSGTIEIRGRTDVGAQQFDQVVTVTPSLRSTLPIAGAVVGGPVGGAAMLVLQGIIGKQVDQLGAVRYTVKGPWADPEITVAEGRTLRDLLQGGTAGTAPPKPAGQQAPAPVDEPPVEAEAEHPAPRREVPVPAFH